MNSSISQWFELYQFPGGRREFALAQVAKVAEQRGWAELGAHAQAAVVHEQQLRNSRRELASARSKKVNPRLSELDPMIDRTIGSIYRVANEVATTLAGTDDGDKAGQLREQIFPEGAAAITTLSHVQQSREVKSVLQLLQGEFAPHVTATGLTAFVERLATLNAEFCELLDAEPSEGVTADQVRAANAAGQENLLGALAMVLGQHWRATDEDVEARSTLLRPIVEQNEAIRSDLRARRSVRDVDPTTGEESAVPEAVATPPDEQSTPQ